MGPKRRIAETALRSTAVQESDAHGPLLDAIAASPEDPAPWAVYSDLLQTEEHPRGELISLMMERERRPSVRLLELQRKHMTMHAATLLPVAIDRERVIAWRRGFASELRLDAPEQLAELQGDPSLRFVESVTLVIGSWAPWRKALRGARMPWRRARIELAGKKLDAAALLACAPRLETLRVVFAKRGAVTWEAARGERLKCLVLVNAGKVELDDAKLPALEELRLLGASVATDALRTSRRWKRLKRVVLAGEAAEDARVGPTVRVAAQIAYPVGRPPAEADDPYDDDDVEQPSTTTFVVVGRPIEPALIEKLAKRMSITDLSARIGRVGSATVMQFFGTAETELLPYGLALALHNVLESTPVALIEVAGGESAGARYLVLADTQARGKDARAADAVRRALDIALGHDPGAEALPDILDELAVTPIEVLRGRGGADQLTMIDPSTAPLVVPEEIEPYDDDEEDEDEDGYYDDDDDWDGLQTQYAEPPPMIVVTVPVEASVEGAVEEEEVDLVFEDVETEDALAEPPQRAELWFDFRDHWVDRAVAVDDEEDEARWPDPIKRDPEHVEQAIDVDRQVAAPACARHGRALEDCRGCDALHCVECGGEDWCSACFGALVGPAPTRELDALS